MNVRAANRYSRTLMRRRPAKFSVNAVGLVEGQRKLRIETAKSDVAQEAERRDAMMRDFVDVEGEFGLNMLMLAFGIVHRRSHISRASFGKFDGDGEVGGLGVADGVADVVGERADGEGEFVGVVGIAKEIDDEVAGADVVGEVREGSIAEGVVADVLDDAAAVGIGARVIELGRSEIGIAAEQQGNDGVFPGEIDELFVGEQRVGRRRARQEQR